LVEKTHHTTKLQSLAKSQMQFTNLNNDVHCAWVQLKYVFKLSYQQSAGILNSPEYFETAGWVTIFFNYTESFSPTGRNKPCSNSRKSPII